MPLLPPVLPHPPALPHHHQCAHPRAPATPGLLSFNLCICKPFINSSTMSFDTLPVRACALTARVRAVRAAAAALIPVGTPTCAVLLHARPIRPSRATHTHTYTRTHARARARTCPPRAAPCAQVHMPALTLFVLLARLVAPVNAAASFATKADLQAALERVVCDQDAAAMAEYGAPDTWDVSGVTDMSRLISGLSCKSTFNAVRARLCWSWYSP